MPLPPKLTVRLSAVTPLFLGGAEPDVRAELRPPSIKGLLRYWYRALDGAYRQNEARFFGSTDTGQSACLLRVDDWKDDELSWQHREGDWRQRTGAGYLGFTLNLPPNQRKAIRPGTTFTLQIQPRPDSDSVQLRRAWLSAIWLLVHVGGVGTRSRRGFGSLRVVDWQGWNECEMLRLPCQARTPEEWEGAARDALGKGLLPWFRNRPVNDHTTLASRSRFRLLRRGDQTWEAALEHAGRLMMQFRENRCEPPSGKAQPDYPRIKELLSKQRQLTEGPVAAGFGLPLTYRYGQWGSVTFRGVEHDRAASPLFLRVVNLADRYHVAFIHLASPSLPPDELLEAVDDQQQSLGRWPQSTRAAHVIDRFLDEVASARDAVGFNVP